MQPFLTLALVATLAAPSLAQHMVAVSWTGSAYSIDSGTGAGVLLGATGFTSLNSMAKDPGTGRIYANSGATIIEIHPTTGAATDVNAANGNQVCDVQALCTAPSGAVFAVQNNVYRVDLNSGLLALVGGGGYSDVRGVEFIGTPFTLTRQGPCPGPVSLATANGTSNSGVALIYGNVGTFTKPSGACAGLTLGLSNPQLAAIITAGGNGSAVIGFNAPLAWCGRTVQAVDITTCTASNTIVL